MIVTTTDRRPNLSGSDLVKREMVRTFSIINQVIWPPVIQTLLYVFVFGLALGSRIPRVQGVPLLAVPHPRADHAAGDRANLRRGLELGLPGPLHELDPGAADRAHLGVRDGARLRRRRRAARALHRDADHGSGRRAGPHGARRMGSCSSRSSWSWRCCSPRSGSSPGSWPRSSTTSRCTTTFFITPLVFVGGVFTSTQFLPPVARALSLFNPMFHMIDAFRYSYTVLGDAPLWVSLVVICSLSALAFTAAYRMAAVGYKLRT